MTRTSADFATRVVRWQGEHGRHGLPWQGSRDPYRTWLSEIMLQQTQVATALPYYERFLTRFPTVASLAASNVDEVLALWSGLGYYTRARNLHRCAVEVVNQHGGVFPGTAAALQALPGIGRSTAAAIASFCFGEAVAILDGNVKRVLTRVLGFDADLSTGVNQRRLWELAQGMLPTRDLSRSMPSYTQGLMDLGATVCLSRKPDCARCPVREMCVADREGAPSKYPVKKRRALRTAESLWLLRSQAEDGSVLLAKRPVPGVWAGLYCLPVFTSRAALERSIVAGHASRVTDEAPFLHVLTHKDLHLHPVRISPEAVVADSGEWFAPATWSQIGLPAPVRKLLERT